MANASDETVANDTVQDEINFLRDYFKENIRILSSIGQFSYILKIRVDQYDVSITLQLDESYPAKAPEIIITAPRLTPEQVSHIQQLLQSYSEQLLNRRMVQPIYSRLLDWCSENHIQSLETSTTNNTTTAAAAGHSHRSSANPTPTTTPTSNVNPAEAIKKSAMKTAEDVISRIEWDTQLDKRYFRVGYVDRFLGLQEKAFNEFDFKVDLSTVSDRHSSVLAIPKHRIQYFKYNTEIVWDKETRTDLMFGSTGNQQTIYDVIARHETLMRGNHAAINPDGDEPIEEGNTSVPRPRYLTLTDGAYKPNYFLSIPITDSTVTANYVAYRDHLLSTFPNFFSLRSTTAAGEHVELHVTLVTLYLESSAAVDQCVVALKKLQEQIRYHCSYPERLCLEFDGIDTFYDRVVLVKCTPNQRLDNLRTLIVERLTEKQNLASIFFAGNYYEFVPHITLMKCKRKFSSLGAVAQPEKPFGKQMLNSLQLCSIGNAEQDESGSKSVFALDLS